MGSGSTRTLPEPRSKDRLQNFKRAWRISSLYGA